jgi:hypothetical protein
MHILLADIPRLQLKIYKNCIGGVRVNVLASNAVDRGFEPRSSQTKDFYIGICCFSSKDASLRRKSKDWLTRNQDDTSYLSGPSNDQDLKHFKEWVSDCCLTSTQQFFSYLMARTSYFLWDGDEVRFALDQHAYFDLYSASSLKQQSAVGRTYHPDSESTARGYYRDSNDRSTMTCQMCPVDKITPLNQRGNTAADCTISK